jgi:TonB dependent receptor-like, beta-barrel/Carboxypeptidase regulatory-like domain/TonB-dependent Receptor Plug Domain
MAAAFLDFIQLAAMGKLGFAHSFMIRDSQVKTCRVLPFGAMRAIIGLLVIGLYHSPIMAQEGLLSQAATVNLSGRVVDAQTGEPLAKVKIIIIGSPQRTTTDKSGHFCLRGLAPGELEFYVTTISYGLLKKRVTLKEGEDNGITIALQQETAPLVGEVTIQVDSDDTASNVASAQTLNKSELQALSTVLVGDPIRAAQALPGAGGDDDFRSELTLRGAGFGRIGLYLDRLLLPINPVHTIFGDDNAGSISILNADTISSVSLLSGAFPAKYGDRTAGVLDLETREGNRVKPAGRLAASLLNASALFDGPIRKNRGAWLFSARKSYLNYVLNKLGHQGSNNDFQGIDFTDVQGNATYDLNPRNQIGFSAIFGTSAFDKDRSQSSLGPNDFQKSDSSLWILSAYWNYTGSPRLVTQTRVFVLGGDFSNTNTSSVVLSDGRQEQIGVRSDVIFQATSANRVEAGLYVYSQQGRGFEEQIQGVLAHVVTLTNYDRRAGQDAFYVQDSWSRQRSHLALTGGVRVDRSGLTGQTVVTPRVALSFAPREKWAVRLGWGQYAQFPEFAELFGVRGNSELRAERATHFNLRVERALSSQTHLNAEVYDREDRNLFFSLNDLVIRNGQVTLISFPEGNSVNGYARGLEVTLQRRSANRLAGWVSYSYSKAWLTDRVTGLGFPSNFDQRHTVSAYGSYRITETLNLGGQWRFGSGVPMVGFFREGAPGQLVIGTDLNRLRLPEYSRLDVRLNKAFLFKRSKLTLSVELLNAMAHNNQRQDGQNGEKLLPFLPSAGVAFEF